MRETPPWEELSDAQKREREKDLAAYEMLQKISKGRTRLEVEEIIAKMRNQLERWNLNRPCEIPPYPMDRYGCIITPPSHRDYTTEEREIPHRQGGQKMAKLEITVEVADDNILGKIAKVEEARRNLNNAWADLQNSFTAKYGTTYGNPAEVKEIPAPSGAGIQEN